MSRTYCRKNSTEIDVFEAALYFSNGEDKSCYGLQKSKKEEKTSWRAASRKSLDTTIKAILPQYSNAVIDKRVKENHKTKHPKSPGAKLAQFLNSFLRRKAYSKKKTKYTHATLSVKDENLEKRREYRNNLNYYNESLSSDKNNDNSHLNCYIMSQNERSFRKQVFSDASVRDQFWLQSEKPAKSLDGHYNMLNKNVAWIEEFMQQGGKFFDRAEEESDDDDIGSESSSELFELKNYDLFADQYADTNVEFINRIKR